MSYLLREDGGEFLREDAGSILREDDIVPRRKRLPGGTRYEISESQLGGFGGGGAAQPSSGGTVVRGSYGNRRS